MTETRSLPADRVERAIRRLVVLAVVMPFTLLVAAALYDLSALRRETARHAVLTTDALAEHADKLFEANELILARVADKLDDVPWRDVPNSMPLHDFLVELNNGSPHLESVFLVSADGINAASSRLFPSPPIDVTDRAYFQEAARGNRGLFISPPFEGRISGRVAFTVTRGLWRDGHFDGVVGVTVMPEYLREFYNNVSDRPQDTAAALMRADGVPLVQYPAQSRPPAPLSPQAPVMQMLAAGLDHGEIARISNEGYRQILTFKKLKRWPLVVAYAIAERSYLGVWYSHVAILTVFAAALTLTLWFAGRRTLRSIHDERVSYRLRLEETERRERAESMLQQSQKMEALGRLTGGVAHDFNNLLAAILLSLELAQRRLKDEAIRPLLVAAHDTAKRGAKLTAQMLSFARRQSLAVETVQINQVVEGMDDLLRRSLGGVVTLAYQLSPVSWMIEADRGQLEMALLNLAINARDAMPGGGTLTIATSNVTVEEAAPVRDLRPGDYATIALSDTGTGMTGDVAANAFEPFFTTKEVGKGTGLGLSMVYGFARQSGATAVIESVLGSGTTVRIYLPRSTQVTSPAAIAPVVTPPDAVARTILLVDDDPGVRQVTAELLDYLGHTVISADSGAAACAIADSGRTFDLAMLDFAMPRMNGLECARELRARRPGLPVVIVTGYADPAMLDRAVAEDCRLLRKPFDDTQLREALSAIAVGRAVADNVVPLQGRGESRVG